MSDEQLTWPLQFSTSKSYWIINSNTTVETGSITLSFKNRSILYNKYQSTNTKKSTFIVVTSNSNPYQSYNQKSINSYNKKVTIQTFHANKRIQNLIAF